MAARPIALRAELEPSVQVRLSCGGKLVFGPGTAHLLCGILQYGSVHRACLEMGLSYSKGRKMLKTLEEKLQTPVVDCTQGGYGGGSARLTEAGRYLLERFSCYEHMIQRYAEQQFNGYFSAENGEENSCGPCI